MSYYLLVVELDPLPFRCGLHSAEQCQWLIVVLPLLQEVLHLLAYEDVLEAFLQARAKLGIILRQTRFYETKS